MALVDFLCRLLLVSLHLIVRLYDKARLHLCRWRRKDPSLDQLVHMMQGLDRIPSSIAFVCMSEDVTESSFDLQEKLAKLVRWSVTIGIKHITLFDDQGRLVEQRSYFEKRLQLKHQSSFHPILKTPSSLFDNNDNSHDDVYQVGQSNGFHNSCTLPDALRMECSDGHCSQVYFLSERDARHHMVKLTRDFIRHQRDSTFDKGFNESSSNGGGDCLTRRGSEGRREAMITLTMMENAVESDYPMPDPEVVILMRETPCLFAFCPWQVRLSEIFHLPDCDVQSSTSVLYSLISVLQRFSHCETRFGK